MQNLNILTNNITDKSFVPETTFGHSSNSKTLLQTT